MKPTIKTGIVVLLAATALAGCASKRERSDQFSMEPGEPGIAGGTAPLPGPTPGAYDPDHVGQDISDAAGSTSGTTIFTNVFNGSGGSCVDASTRRGQAIADKLQKTLPSGYTADVHTYSGYRLPFIKDASVHTYTVTQVRGPDGTVKDTWTSDNYLGPNFTTHYTGDGGYNNWGSDYLTNPVSPTNQPPKQPKATREKSGSGGGGGAGGGGGGGGGGGEG